MRTNLKIGRQWRNLPHDFPPVFSVNSFYRRAHLNDLWDKILGQLVKFTRHIQRCKRYAVTAGYRRSFIFKVYKYFGMQVEISKKLKKHEWQVLPKCWRVERTFAWFNQSRRLSKNYELTVASAESLIKISYQ